jgi:hypothetical protein
MVVIGRTGRYGNLLMDWKKLESYKDQLLFLGTDAEHEDFCGRFFNVTGLIPGDGDSLLDCARLLASCKGYIGGVSGIYAVAEMMKIPRVLITPDWMPQGMQDGKTVVAAGPKNVFPLGGRCCTANRTQRVLQILPQMLAQTKGPAS